MKRLPLLPLLVLLCACTVAAPSLAAPRVMLVESFTNTSCAPCASNNPIVHQFMQDYGPGLAVNVQNHVWWPGANDPFYLLTATTSEARVNYYGVTGVPTTVCDGTAIGTHSYATLEAAAAASLLNDAALQFEITQTDDGANATITVTVEAQAAVPTGDHRLRVALVETEITTATPPGTNGETAFYYTMRRMLPDALGTSVALAEWTPETFQWTTPIDSAWNYGKINVVAWVQDDDTQAVLQAATNVPRPAYQFYYGAAVAGDILPLGSLRTFDSLLINAGESADTYDLHIAPNLPAGWSASVCANDFCYPPWTTDIAVPLGAGATDSVTVDIAPATTAGTGTVTITATSRGDPTKTWTRVFKVITPGSKVLIVDNDGTDTFETYYQTAINACAHSWSIWDRQANGKLTSAKLDYFPIVVWIGGNTYPPVGPEDRAALAEFLDDGGRLFISGQDIGWSLCDPSSADYSAESLAWYHHYLGADFINDDTNDLSITGVAGDPIGNGLVFNLSGSGANAQTYPSEINPRTGATGFLIYSANREAAVRYASGPFKVVYLAYGFEGQMTASSRSQVMCRSLDWLGVNLVDVPEADTGPYLASAPGAVPNPFNPVTEIAFATGGADAPAEVVIFDLRGRLVRHLFAGTLPAGDHRFAWNGRDEAGQAVASGVYLARVRAAGEERAFKLALTR